MLFIFFPNLHRLARGRVLYFLQQDETRCPVWPEVILHAPRPQVVTGLGTIAGAVSSKCSVM